jgi:HEAT repeat protein
MSVAGLNRWLAIGLLWLAGSGCAALEPSNWAIWRSKSDDAIESPAERVRRYQQYADDVERKSPEEQEQVSRELAEAIAGEDDPIVRTQIVRTLAVYPTDLAARVLTAALQDEDPHVRVIACEAWGERGGSDAIHTLGQVVRNEKDVDVRLAAVRGLGSIKDAATVQALAPGLEDEDVAVQWRTMQSLREATGKSLGNDVEAWRQFALGADVSDKEESLAEKLRRRLF